MQYAALVADMQRGKNTDILMTVSQHAAVISQAFRHCQHVI